MKKLGLVIVFLIAAMLTIQCTEDETVEAAQYEAVNVVDGGEEGDQELDSERDWSWNFINIIA